MREETSYSLSPEPMVNSCSPILEPWRPSRPVCMCVTLPSLSLFSHLTWMMRHYNRNRKPSREHSSLTHSLSRRSSGKRSRLPSRMFLCPAYRFYMGSIFADRQVMLRRALSGAHLCDYVLIRPDGWRDRKLIFFIAADVLAGWEREMVGGQCALLINIVTLFERCESYLLGHLADAYLSPVWLKPTNNNVMNFRFCFSFSLSQLNYPGDLWQVVSLSLTSSPTSSPRSNSTVCPETIAVSGMLHCNTESDQWSSGTKEWCVFQERFLTVSEKVCCLKRVLK